MNFIHLNEQVQPIFGQCLILFWDALNWISFNLDALVSLQTNTRTGFRLFYLKKKTLLRLHSNWIATVLVQQ